jgi:hypothetical protein
MRYVSEFMSNWKPLEFKRNCRGGVQPLPEYIGTAVDCVGGHKARPYNELEGYEWSMVSSSIGRHN